MLYGSVAELREVQMFGRLHSQVVEKYPKASGKRQLYETIRRMVDHLVSDLIVQSQENIAAAGVTDITAVRRQSHPLISLSEAVLDEHQELKRFLRTKLYNHPRVREVMDEARSTLKELFETYLGDSSLLPADHRLQVTRAKCEGGTSACARVVADYVAGMTDRFAITERIRLKDLTA